MIVMLAAAALIVCLILLFAAIVPPYTGVIIARFGKPVRSAGPGLAFLFRPFERIAEECSLKRRSLGAEFNAETKDEEIIKLDLSIEYEPKADVLIRFLGFSGDQLEGAIAERIKGLCSIAVREKKDRDEVLDNLKSIADRLQNDFRTSRINGLTIEEHYGIHLISIFIEDPELPKELADAEVRREIQEKENEKRDLEMTNIRKQARQLVEEAKKRGDKLSFEAALKRIQVQRGIVKEEHRVYGLDPQTLRVGGDFATSIAAMIFKKGGKRGR